MNENESQNNQIPSINTESIIRMIPGDTDIFKGSNNLPTFLAPPTPPPLPAPETK